MGNRFILQPSKEQGFWVATDTEHGIVVKFREHQFNETQQITLLDDVRGEDFMVLARYMRELGDWMAQNHYDIAMGKC